MRIIYRKFLKPFLYIWLCLLMFIFNIADGLYLNIKNFVTDQNIVDSMWLAQNDRSVVDNFKTNQAQAAVAYQSAGALNYSAGTKAGTNVAYPASVAAGDLLVLLIGMKPSTANGGTVATPSGWTNITSLTGAGGYGTTLGADTGNTNIFSYYKVAAGTESGNLLVITNVTSVVWMQMYRLSNTTQDWSVAGTTGQDTTTGAAVSIAMSADPGVTAGDFILGAMVIPTDVSTPSQFSAEALSQSGVSFGTVTEISEPDTSTGNDIGGFVIRSTASSGTSSGVPTMTATAGGTTTNVMGPGIFIRIRATGTITYQTPGAVAYNTITAANIVEPAYPASVAAGDLLVLLIGMKPSTANSGSVTTPSGWTNITSLTGAGGYGTTLAADTGNTNIFSYYKVAAGTESGSLTTIMATVSVAWAQIYRFNNSSKTWSVAGTTGQDTTTGAAVSIAMSADPGVTTGDFILGAMVIPTDISTPSQFSAESLTQSGVSFGTVTEISEPDTGNGNDIGGFVVRSSVSSGTSTGVPTLSATAGGTTTNVMGPGIFIRIREVPPTFSQSAYRFFANNDSTDVGTVLADQDTAATLSAAGDAFRLRLLLHVASGELVASGESFKLQFAEKSGTCDTAYSGETYADVTAGTVIAYKDNSPADGDNLTSNANDPTHSGHTIVNQDYEELNNFTNSVATIPIGQDGKWDFALFDNGATAGTSYCLRVVLSSGTAIDTPTVVPEIIMAASTGVSISLSTDGSVNFGNLALEATQDNTATGVDDIEVVSVDTGPADLDIESTVFTEGANTWTLGASNGSNQVKWEFATSTIWTIITSADTPHLMSPSVPQSETRDIKLRITAPTMTDSYSAYSATVTITASAP